MKQRLLVMNGQRLVQNQEGSAWHTKKVEKAADTLKAGIYDIYNASKADTKAKHEGMIVHTDSDCLYQQVGKNKFVMHRATDFDIVPKVGESKVISYKDDGKAHVTAATEKLSRGKTL